MTTKTNAPYGCNPVLNADAIRGAYIDGMNASHNKPGNPTTGIIVTLKKAHDFNQHEEVITIKVFEPKRYRTGMEKLHACVWIHDRATSTKLLGSDYAGGCGYHKESAAIDGAIENAGIELERSFGGCGAEPTMIAIKEIMRALGHTPDDYIVTMH